MEIDLGDVAKDTITGFEGVVIARTKWLLGCDRLTIQPQKLHDAKPIDPITFDEPQCVLVRKKAVVKKEKAPTGGPRPEPTRRR